MALRAVHVVLAVVAVSLSMEHVVGYQERPEEDMSVGTASDGELKLGHYGDYSDWVKKYHLGKHVPFHATKREAAKETSVQFHHTHKEPSAAPPAQFARDVKQAEGQPVSKPEKKRSSPPVSKKAKKVVKHTKTAKKAKQPKKEAKKKAKKKSTEAEPSVADELESELNSLEHKAAGSNDGTTVQQQVAHKEQQKPEKSPKSNLAESKGDTISLDTLEASLNKLESVPTAMVQFPSTHSKSLASDSTGDTMGAAYTVTQESLDLHNFPSNHRLKKKKAVAAFQRAIKVEEAPKPLVVKETHQSKKESEKAKMGKKLEDDAAKFLKQKRVSLDVQLDRLAATAETDAQSLDNFDAVSLIQEGAGSKAKAGAKAKAKAVATAPDMMSMLANRFKKKARAHRKRLAHQAVKDEDESSEKEAEQAKKFQMAFTQSLNKRVKDTEDQAGPKTIQEALAKTSSPKHKHKMGKGSEPREDQAAMKDAEAAKKMTKQFLAYREKMDKKKANTNKAPTKESLAALFGKKDEDDEDLGENDELPERLAKKNIGTDEMSFAKQALDATHKEHKQQPATKQNLASLFGVKNTDANAHKDMHQELGEGHAGLLDESDARALRIQKQMLQNMLQKQNQANAHAAQESEGDIASLFGRKKSKKSVKLMSASRERAQAQFAQAKEQQERMLRASSERDPRQRREADTKEELTKDNLASLFKGKTKELPQRVEVLPRETQEAMKMQRQFMQKTKHVILGENQDDDEQPTKKSMESLFTHENSAETTSEAETASNAEVEMQREMVQQTKSRKGDELGEARLGRETGNNHADIEHLFQGKMQRNKKSDQFDYMSKGQRKNLQSDFVESANHQIQLLRQMEQSQAAAVENRAQESIQTSENAGKWDEYAYQNKLRGLFGAKKLVKPPKRKLRHKNAVNEFLADVKQEEQQTPEKKRKLNKAIAEQHLSQDQLKQTFTDLIQVETAQFNKMMDRKEKETGSNQESKAFLDTMKSKFAELKERVRRFSGVKKAKAPNVPTRIPNQETLVQIKADYMPSESDAKPAKLVRRQEVDETDDQEDSLHSSMLSRVSKLFHDA